MREVVLIAELVLHLAPLGFLEDARAPTGAVPERAEVLQLAQRAVLDAFHRLEVTALVPALEANADLEVLLLRVSGGGEHAAHAGRVDGHRLLHEDVLAP